MRQNRIVLEMTSGDRVKDGIETQVTTRYHWLPMGVGGRFMPVMDTLIDTRGAINAYGVRAVNRLGQVTKWEPCLTALEALAMCENLIMLGAELIFHDEE